MRLIDADALMERLHEFANDDWNKSLGGVFTDAVDTCIDFVENAETIEAVPVVHGWIPCSERLPECEDYAETDALLFQLQSGTIEIGYFGRKNAWRDEYFRHYRTPCGVDVSDVAAWMPLPEPYKEE